MHCTECGKKLSQNSKFCGYCGAEIVLEGQVEKGEDFTTEIIGKNRKKIQAKSKTKTEMDKNIEKITKIAIEKFGAEKDANSVQKKVKEITKLELKEENLSKILEILKNKKDIPLNFDVWIKFVCWTIIIWIILMIYIGTFLEMFEGNIIFTIGKWFGLLLFGIIVGSILYFIWRAITKK